MNEKIEVIFEDSIKYIITEEKLIEEYKEEYNKVKNEFAAYFRKGEGEKTNKYHEPVMNKAYNYIEHEDFKRQAFEPFKGYDENNRPKSTPVKYDYYLSVWSIACSRVEKKYDNQFRLKFDHRYIDRKNNDFDGFLVCFKDFSFWKNRNLPNNQRYNDK